MTKKSWMRPRLLLLAVAAGLALCAGTASAELVAILPQVLNPFHLTIADGRMYVVENSVAVHIFMIEDRNVSFVKTVGREGRELRRMDLPFTGRLSNGILFCFYEGRYFYLRENPDEEVWELHVEKAW